ncbi:MAG: mannitol dehydrogenase family protein, partial [Rhodobacteraceae bacterium]|nr:mannitol dehydrogenase family protein [Paracoccaceae bacterium]
PATGPNELALVCELGIADAAPVTHEDFRQWVIEDDFCAGRPEWERVGATVADDVHAYEMMKLRLLNGGHQIIAAPAELLGLHTIADAMAHPLIKEFLRKVCLTEIAPNVASVPGMSPAGYVDLIDQRFSNPAIHDTVRRVAFDGSSRQTGAVIPAIRDAIDQGGPLDGLALSQALWAMMCTGRRQDGSIIKPNDPNWDRLHQAAKGSMEDPKVWLAQREFYGALGAVEPFEAAFASASLSLVESGVEAILQAYLEG